MNISATIRNYMAKTSGNHVTNKWCHKVSTLLTGIPDLHSTLALCPSVSINRNRRDPVQPKALILYDYLHRQIFKIILILSANCLVYNSHNFHLSNNKTQHSIMNFTPFPTGYSHNISNLKSFVAALLSLHWWPFVYPIIFYLQINIRNFK